MNIAVITGASSGLGVEYLKHICEMYPTIQQYWIVARRKERLEALVKGYPDKKIVPISLDLQDYKSYDVFDKLLKENDANIKIFVNNAGYGVLGNVHESDYIGQAGMVDLNCRALTALTGIALKYMQEGSFIVNVCSIASFCPNARMTVYSSTKAYVRSFSRGIRFENRKRGINCLAVCPGPMETEFLSVAGISGGKSKTFETLPYCNPSKVAKKSLIYAEKGRAIYTPTAFYKFYRVLAKLAPHGILMHFSKT